MTEYGYSVLAEFWGKVPNPDVAEALLAELSETVGPVVSTGPNSLALRFSLVFDWPMEPVEVAGAGAKVALRAIDVVGLSHFTLEALGIQTDAHQDRELARPDPELIGLSEVAGILGVSKQRVGQLREREDFPIPVAEIAAGPVWQRPMLDRFIRDWPRRPGRPAGVGRKG